MPVTSDIFQTMAGGAPSREPYEDTRERIQELHVFSWNVTGMRTVDFDTWLQHIGEAHPWDIIFIQEGVRSFDELDAGGHSVFVPCFFDEGFGCPAVVLNRSMSGRARQL